VFFLYDLGGEYTSSKFPKLLASEGTIHETSCIDSPKQNGVVAQKQCYIVELLVPSFVWFYYKGVLVKQFSYCCTCH